MSNHHVSPSNPSTTSFPSCHTHQVQPSYLSIMNVHHVQSSCRPQHILSSCRFHHVIRIMFCQSCPTIMSFTSCHIHHAMSIMSLHQVLPSCRPHHVVLIMYLHHVISIMSNPPPGLPAFSRRDLHSIISASEYLNRPDAKTMGRHEGNDMIGRRASEYPRGHDGDDNDG